MSQDTQIRDRLHATVDDTTVAPGFALAVLRRGRSRRRRRHAAGGIAAAVVLTVGAVVLQPEPPVARDALSAASRADGTSAAMEWARSLPAGPDASLPFYGQGGLWSNGRVTPLPETVNQSIVPRPVSGGWLVVLGQSETHLAYAVMSTDGSMRRLPAATYENGLGDTRVAISDDGRRVALGSWIVDLETMQLSDLPHAPARESAQGYYTAIRVLGFTDQGLVYDGAPFEEGLGTTYLLSEDGTETRIDLPADAHVPDGSPADLAVKYAYNDDESDTCLSSYRLQSTGWVEGATGCLGRALGEALAVSPDGRWLLTDDLPEVWDLAQGRSTSIDIPTDEVKSWGDGWLGAAVWEDRDSFLVPMTDSRGESGATEPYDQTVQVVRCTMSTGECQRAGEEQDIVVRSEGMSTTGVRFATPGH